jgi:putative endonuclease
VKDRQYYVYILTNAYNTVLYTGITNDLPRRVLEHRSGKGCTFTSRYRVNKLVYFETTEDVRVAISREKQIKAGSRQTKLDLVNSMNPEWNDLFLEYFT